ncbi:uncharacterized mitochondrial protein AtMg00810-like [Juglans microcarpa x Juglans regia]|uniref:uncharacterized mitochondrial protein AtMg00810-like n=1 Tax=Juglans microcarpa x Juglans regia TaxID=2249226 RepID=UPI001B7F431B|nr:uncharacterized mitochondrial protein AtMg00810-like [Juglans microcarpa x Juglans regia]
MQHPRDTHLTVVKRIFHYLKGTINLGLHFIWAPITTLRSYCDADSTGSKDDRRSTTNFAIFMANNSLSWEAKKQATISRSTAEAEYRALATTIVELIWFLNLLQSIGYSTSTPTLYCDNINAINMAKNLVFYESIIITNNLLQVFVVFSDF